MHQKEDNLEVSQAKRMLREIGQMAEDASLTGSIKTGAARLAEFYNRVLNQLEEDTADDADQARPDRWGSVLYCQIQSGAASTEISPLQA